jgi:hypothetical protein
VRIGVLTGVLKLANHQDSLVWREKMPFAISFAKLAQALLLANPTCETAMWTCEPRLLRCPTSARPARSG